MKTPHENQQVDVNKVQETVSVSAVPATEVESADATQRSANETTENNTNNVDAADEDEKIDVTFGKTKDSDSESEEDEDLSKYTVVDADHLMEDDPLKGQEFCLLSFMSPEGIMNCNVRAVKFRGAFPTLKAAEKYASTLEEKDEYFQIFAGESGKWLDFDPPASKVEREKTSNPQHQKILDAQAKQRMTKINELAGKTKQMIDKKKKGKKDMIEEKKKAGAAQETVDKKRGQKQKDSKSKSKEKKSSANRRGMSGRNLEDMKERMRNKLAEKQNKKRLQKMNEKEKSGSVDSNASNESKPSLDKKIKVVGKISAELETKKQRLEAADKNIERIKALMEKRKNKQ